MRFNKFNNLNGDQQSYQINPDIKVFTVRDMRFENTNAGNFIYTQTLSGDEHSPRVKIVIKRDLKSFKMDITDAKGFRKVNIFDGKHPKEVQDVRYLLDSLVLRKIFKKV